MKRKAVRNHTLALLFFFLSLPLLTETVLVLKEESNSKNETLLNKQDTESILYIGDVMLGRHVEKIAVNSGFNFVFKDIRSLLFDSTYVIANLEGPVPSSEHHKTTPSNGFSFNFAENTVNTLSEYHISSVSLANNHTSDQGEEAYWNTKKVLSEKHIASFGHSRYFSYDHITNRLGFQKIITVGVNMITPAFSMENVTEGINSICSQNKDAVLFAFIHAGTEYTHEASASQKDLAHTLIDTTCIHTIIGSHPHVVQGVEYYKGHYIFYSLGNFIFDQYFSEETQEGYALKVMMRNNSLSYTIIPIYQEMSAPRLADGKRKEKIMNDILQHSYNIPPEKKVADTFFE